MGQRSLNLFFFLNCPGPGRPRNTASKSNRTSVSKHAVGRPTSPLHNIPLPIPNSVNNSPVQSVPINIAVNQGPLPSFATIVSSSKLFNPGASLGNTMLASKTVTSTVSSCPLTTVSLLSSKPNTVTQNVCVSSSAPASLTKTAGLVHTNASNVASPAASSAIVSNQQPVTVQVQIPTTNRVATLPKHATATDTNSGNLPITVSAHSSIGSCEALSVLKGVASTVTSVMPTKGKAVSPTKQITKSSSDAMKSSEVKVPPKPVVPHTSKASRPYGGRKTVAATLKAAASAAKVSSALALTRAVVPDSSPQGMHAVATATPGASCQVVSAGRSSEVTSQVLPMAPMATTVQAPALFHNVLKGTMGKEQGQLSHHMATTSTQAQKTAATLVVTSNSARLSHAVHSTHSKTETQEKDQISVSLAQSAMASHVSVRPQVHAAAQRPQQQASGYSAIKSGTSFHGQVSLASSISQQANVPSTTLSPAHTQVQALPSSIYGHGSSQIPSLQIAGSQTQGGVFVQGSGNQMFQMNVADSNQLKGAFQLQGALYQGALPTTFFAANNTAGKAAVPHAPGGVTQAVYSTNPYMLGILMPTAMSQSVTSASASSTVTAASSSVTTATAPVPSVASYSYNNQNAAIAAAFESFVPIAPAASPRFSQTLAHLASAYTPFVPRGVVQGNTPLQFTQRMVPMGNTPAPACGNGQMGAPVLNLTDYTLKYPINAVKPSSYTTQVSTPPSAGSVNTPQQAALVTAMPYVAFGQINNPRFPFAVNFAAPGAGANSSVTVSTPTGVGSTITSATSSHYPAGGGGTVDSHAGGAVLGYVAMPFNANASAGAVATPHPFTGSAFSAPSSNTGVSCSSQGDHTLGPQHVTWCGLGGSPGGSSQRGCHTPENNSPGCYISTTSASVSVPLSRSTCANIVSRTPGIVTSTPTSTNCSQPQPAQSARYLGVSCPLNSPTTFAQSSTPLPTCPGLSANETPKHVRKSSQEGIAAQPQTYSVSDCYKKRNSPPGIPCTLQRTCSEGSDSKKRTKYDESAYYEANPLLGLKRSCEAIEAAYSEPDNDANPRKPAKNDKASPGNGGRSGEACTKSNNYENLNKCAELNFGSEGKVIRWSLESFVTSFFFPVAELENRSHGLSS